MWGGPSQFETYDPKPNAPTRVPRAVPADPHGRPRPGHLRTVPPPGPARRSDLAGPLAPPRDVVAQRRLDRSADRQDARRRPDPTSTAWSDHPDFGMVASRVARAAARRPAAVRRHPDQPFMTRPTYLGVSHQGFATGDPSRRATSREPALGAADGGPTGRSAGAAGQLRPIAASDGHAGAIEGPISSTPRPTQLLTSPAMAQAFDLAREPARLRDRYGRHLWGQKLPAGPAAGGGRRRRHHDRCPGPRSRASAYFSWDDHVNPRPVGPGDRRCVPGRRHGPGAARR